MPFPTSLLNHLVKVIARVSGLDADNATVETPTALGTVSCSITSVSSSRGLNDQDVPVITATLTGTDPLLGKSNVLFEVVQGPTSLTAGIKLYPSGGMSPHGNGFIDDFYRFPVTSILPS